MPTTFLNKYDPLKGQVAQILDENGNHKENLVPKELTPQIVQKLYENIIFVRTANDRMFKLQRQGRMGTFASVKGQEACQVGSAYALEKTDWIVPAFREIAAMWMHGMPIENIMLYWRGNEAGSKPPHGVRVLPVSIPVGSQMLHAVGLSWASALKLKLQKPKKELEKMKNPNQLEVAVTYFGDGATSEGDFHEAMNFASLYKTPTVLLCQNNQYAISVPRHKQTASRTIAQKAIGYDMPGIQVDGNDLLAMYAVTKEAVDYARAGNGPVLIEALTYRLDDHTTSDDATKYRTQEEVDTWLPKDPVLRLQKYLAKYQLWDKKYEEALKEKCDAEVAKAIEKMEQTPDPTVEEMFAYTYQQMTPEQQRQLQQAKSVADSQNSVPPQTS